MTATCYIGTLFTETRHWYIWTSVLRSPLKSSYILPSISANRHFEYQIVRTANWTFPKRKMPNFWQMYFMPNINVLKFHPILPLQSHSNWNWNTKWTIELWNQQIYIWPEVLLRVPITQMMQRNFGLKIYSNLTWIWITAKHVKLAKTDDV